MATTTCGWCGRDVHMTQLNRHPEVRGSSYQRYVSDAAYRCDNPKCGRFSVVSWYTDYDPSESYRSGEPEDYDRTVIWSPPPIERREYPDVPQHLQDAAREAWLCLAHDARIGACSVARAVIEAAAKAHNVTVRGIKAKIIQLRERGLIWGDLVDSVEMVREFGNDAAHGDVTDPPSVSEVRDVLDILDELLHQLFTSPERSKRLRAARGLPEPGSASSS